VVAIKVFSAWRVPDFAGTLEHDPEKWKPVFRKDHAPRRPKTGHQPEAIARWDDASNANVQNGLIGK
jgi:hypothetical protein